MEEARKLNEEYDRLSKAVFDRTAPSMPPLAEELVYKYDYGDGWTVRITVSDEYRMVFEDDNLAGVID